MKDRQTKQANQSSKKRERRAHRSTGAGSGAASSKGAHSARASGRSASEAFETREILVRDVEPARLAETDSLLLSADLGKDTLAVFAKGVKHVAFVIEGPDAENQYKSGDAAQGCDLLEKMDDYYLLYIHGLTVHPDIKRARLGGRVGLIAVVGHVEMAMALAIQQFAEVLKIEKDMPQDSTLN